MSHDEEVELSPQVGNIVVVKYETKRKVLSYLGVVQSVDEEGKFQVQYLKRSGEKTYTLKEDDKDDVNKTESLL